MFFKISLSVQKKYGLIKMSPLSLIMCNHNMLISFFGFISPARSPAPQSERSWLLFISSFEMT